MKDQLYNAGLRLGLSIRKKAQDRRVRDLFSSMRPRKTDVDLVRLGGPGDGGYLVPDDLAGLHACFSPGVDVTASFESALIERGVKCYLADASVPGPPFVHDLLDFEPRFIGAANDARFMTMDAWMKDKGAFGNRDLILQMDIEGAEWPVLLNMSDEALSSFRIVVIEMHELPRLFDNSFLTIAELCMKRLLHFFHVVHVHPNNVKPLARYKDMAIPHDIEITLHRKDRSRVTGKADRFPHPLDSPNVAGKPDFALPMIFRE